MGEQEGEKLKEAIQKAVSNGYQQYRIIHGPPGAGCDLIKFVTGAVFGMLQDRGWALADAATRAKLELLEGERNRAITKLRRHQDANKRLAVETGRADPSVLKGEAHVLVLTRDQLTSLGDILEEVEFMKPEVIEELKAIVHSQPGT